MPSSAFANPSRHQHWDVQEGSAKDLAPDLENSLPASQGSSVCEVLSQGPGLAAEKDPLLVPQAGPEH